MPFGDAFDTISGELEGPELQVAAETYGKASPGCSRLLTWFSPLLLKVTKAPKSLVNARATVMLYDVEPAGIEDCCTWRLGKLKTSDLFDKSMRSKDSRSALSKVT